MASDYDIENAQNEVVGCASRLSDALHNSRYGYDMLDNPRAFLAMVKEYAEELEEMIAELEYIENGGEDYGNDD